MLKIRIEGKKEEIYKYLDLIQKDEHLEICDISNCYPNHGVSKYNRCFVELEMKEGNEDEENN